jgi:hypothetical protein
MAAWHCVAPSYEQTERSKILDLYNDPDRMKSSPIVALNRTELANVPAARGEFELLGGRPAEARVYFQKKPSGWRGTPPESAFVSRTSEAVRITGKRGAGPSCLRAAGQRQGEIWHYFQARFHS